jgi:riboflavin synthase
MFTGIVQAVGEIRTREETPNGVRLEVESEAIGPVLKLGDSVAVSGVCLTVEEVGDQSFWVQATEATIARTQVGAWRRGDLVNLEAALRAGDALGGHLVQGHVDGVADVLSVEEDAKSGMLEVRLPAGVASVTVPQGSLALDGVSLTVNSLEGAVARLAIIPYTWSHTTLGELRRGNRVHVEGDIIAKYVDQAVAPYLDPGG